MIRDILYAKPEGPRIYLSKLDKFEQFTVFFQIFLSLSAYSFSSDSPTPTDPLIPIFNLLSFRDESSFWPYTNSNQPEYGRKPYDNYSM